MAQTTSTFSNTTTGNINGTTTCAAPLVRTFSVTGVGIIADVNIGIRTTHTWRGDHRMTLQSPAGTRVQIVNGDADTISGDNFNVLLDDSAAQLVNTDSPTGNHGTSAPPYQNTFQPNNPLTAFSGQNANGTWQLEICDIFPSADNGSFRRADLYLTTPPASFADLSLVKTLIGSAPSDGGIATWRLTVSSAAGSTLTANGVQVRDILPIGFTFDSATGIGTYDPGTGIWTVGTVTPGQSRSIDITGTVTATAGATITNTAEIIVSSAPDSDSTVDNGSASEDDYASSSFVVAGSRSPGVPPVLSCPAGSVLFDWDAQAWGAGSTTNSYALDVIGQIDFDMQNPGLWLNNAGLGGQSPNRQNIVHGATNQNSIIQLVDLPDRDAVVTTTVTLPEIMRGAQFALFDIDFGTSQFADRVQVEGRYLGATVIPVLTNGISNYVVGNQAFGDLASNNNQANGNVTVTFTQPIDTIIIAYGNHSAAPVNPGQQAISIHDFTFCRPTTSIVALKTSSVVSDPVNGASNPKAVPGATMRYCLLFTNTGDTAATNVVATDPLPANVTYVPGSMLSGTSCGSASQAEDDNNSGADESDPVGASIAANTIIATRTTLAAGQAFAIVFNVLVN